MYSENNGFGESKGHLRAIVAVYTPIDADNKEMLLFFWSIEGLMSFIFLLIYGVIYHYSQTITQKDALIARQSRFAAMGEMIGMIAHQWRQPLTGMSMTVSNMKLDIELSMVDEKKWEQQLDIIEKQIAYLSHTIDDFRNFFKPNQALVLVNIKELIEGSLGVIASTLSSHNIEITIVCDDHIVLNTSRNDLMQVLLNLIKNAKDAYVDTGISPSSLTIEVTKDERLVKIMVKDNAGGISPTIIHDIFNPYFSTKDEKNGTGLGLYMSKMIIEEHLGGKLEVSSSNGSTQFIILLPIGEVSGN
jgi:signal transduction histidine kinase